MATLTQRWCKPPAGGNEDDSDEQEEEEENVQQPDDNKVLLPVGGGDDAGNGEPSNDNNGIESNAADEEEAGEESDEFELDQEVLVNLSQLYAENEHEDDGVPDGDATSTSSVENADGAACHRDLFTQQQEGVDENEEDEDDGIQGNQQQPVHQHAETAAGSSETSKGGIDQYLNAPPAKKLCTRPKDTDEAAWIEVPGDNTSLAKKLKCFKVGEIFRSSQRKHRGKIFVIEKLYWRGETTKKAECRVYRRLSDTYIESYSRDSYSLEGEAKYVAYRYTQTVPLKKLDSGLLDIANFPPDERRTLIWHHNEKGNTGVDFRIAYTVGKLRNDKIRRRSVPIRGCQPIKVLELFAGAGGMSIGLTKAGMSMAWAVESDLNAAATWRLNHTRPLDDGTPPIMFCEDVLSFFAKVKAGVRPYSEIVSNVSHIHGSPPCQGFSKANRTGGKDDEKNRGMTDLFFDIVLYLKPATVSMENVDNILHPTYERYLKAGIAKLLEAGYQCALMNVDATSFGDPQARKRAILIAAKDTLLFCPNLRPIHGKEGTGLAPIVTPSDVLADLEDEEPSDDGVFRSMSTADIIYDHTSKGTSLPDNPEEIVQLYRKEPSKTLTKSNKLKHYSKNRALTIRELARLQSFPDTFHILGDVLSQRNQIGNAVPCKLAEAVGLAIVQSYP